jgi:hypothetical protein
MTENKAMKSGKSRGEHHSLAGHPTKMIHLNESEANLLCKLVSKKMGWPLFSCEYTKRVTVARNATVWKDKKRMIVHLSGERVSTILHELAHIKGHRHDDSFKSAHLMLLDLWEKEFKAYFKIEQAAEVVKPKKAYTKPIIMPKKFFTDIEDTVDSAAMPVKKTEADLERIVDEVVEEILLEVADESMKIAVGVVGKLLAERKANKLETVQAVKGILINFGFQISVGG